MAEKLFPERQRCKACRRSLGASTSDPVLFGLYCSARCASIPEPAVQAGDAPRECRTQRDGGWVFKRRYRCVGEIPQRIKDDPGTSRYTCGHCGHLHLGRALVERDRPVRASRYGLATTEVTERRITSRADLADLLVKLRGQATHKQVAATARVRPIRVKEWEDPGFDSPSLGVLFALAKVYRVDLSVVFRR